MSTEPTSHITTVECACVAPRGSRRAADPQCENCSGSGEVEVCGHCLGLGRFCDDTCRHCGGNGYRHPADGRFGAPDAQSSTRASSGALSFSRE